MAAKKTAKKITKTKGRAKSAKKTAKKDNFRTFSALSRVDAARRNYTLPRDTVVKIETTDTMRDEVLSVVKVKIGTPKKGTMFQLPLSEFLSQAIKLMGFKQDDAAILPDFGTPVSAKSAS